MGQSCAETHSDFFTGESPTDTVLKKHLCYSSLFFVGGVSGRPGGGGTNYRPSQTPLHHAGILRIISCSGPAPPSDVRDSDSVSHATCACACVRMVPRALEWGVAPTYFIEFIVTLTRNCKLHLFQYFHGGVTRGEQRRRQEESGG